ncbi:MAG: ElyC/SanA/YdcF family protein [Halomonas sp.]|uniref:ElyC/SanA/YdcF family protein n=1 Tax=unclassified Halomonas TaxID=2609666 RepID=UPI003CEB6960
MYPVLKTLIAQLFMPLPITILLVVIGLIIYRLGHHKFGGGVVLSGFVFLLLLSWGPVAERLLAPFEHRYSAVIDWPRGEEIDTVVVLGGGWSPGLDVSLTGQLGDSSVARLMEGIRLWQQQPESTLLVTGASRHGDGMPIAQGYARAAITLGVPPTQLQVIGTPTDTAQEAQAVREQLGEGAGVLLVTSASHMPRAVC